jgi:catechol 2,3-dioxygenase
MISRPSGVHASAHPKLQHLGLATANLDAMVDWYRKVLGMTINRRLAPAAGEQKGPPFSAAFLSNDEVHHRIVFFELPGLAVDPDKRRHVRLQHLAFEYQTLDDLLGTYARLKGMGILPVMAADEGLQTSIYYTDPDGNNVELNVNNYGNELTATEHMKAWPAERPTVVHVDPEKMLEAPQAGASPWEVHERAFAGELAPAKPYDLRAFF